jgi:murein DD-endopeptidase MepM/ murein hydrolase activator NlpD
MRLFLIRDKIKILSFFLFFLFVSQLAAQEYSPPGIFHKIKRGQSLWSIARTYGVDILDLMKFNRLKEPSLIYAGRYIFIPGVKRSITSGGNYRYKSKRYKIGKSPFIWPVKGKVTSNFGFHGGKRRHGIEIACAELSIVRASDKGIIASAGILRGYGNIIIIDHRNGYYTIYAHNQRNMTSRGETVKKGQQIALAGSTGRASQSCVYFEIRKGAKAVNPLRYLP